MPRSLPRPLTSTQVEWVLCLQHRASHQPCSHHDLAPFICARAPDTYACVSCLVVTPVATTYVRLHTPTTTHRSGKVQRTTRVFTLAESPRSTQSQPPTPLHGGWHHNDDSGIRPRGPEEGQASTKAKRAGHARMTLQRHAPIGNARQRGVPLFARGARRRHLCKPLNATRAVMTR